MAVKGYLRNSGQGKFQMYLFLKILQENNSLRKSYENYFINKVKPLLNKKTAVVNPPKVVVLNMTLTLLMIPRQLQISKARKMVTFENI